MPKHILLALLLLSGAPTDANAQAAADPHDKHPGLGVQSGDKIANFQVMDAELAQQARAFAALRQRPASEHAAAVRAIADTVNAVPPAQLFEAARRLWEMGQQEQALEWYALGSMRALYDAARCTDPTAPQGVIMLGRIAPEVARGIEQHRSAYGAAGLRVLGRSDLFASTVSPWWICSHGIRAIGSGMANQPVPGPSWLKPESEWEAIRTELRRQFAVLFAEQSKPQDDPIAKSEPPLPSREIGVGDYGAYAWLDADWLVYAESVYGGPATTILRLWQRNGSETELARFKGPWCAGNGTIAYQVKLEPTGGKSSRVTFMVGTPGNWQEQIVEFEGIRAFPQLVHDGSFGFTAVSDSTRQSPFDCRWTRSRILSGQYGDRQWVPLLPGHGLLSFSRLTGSPGDNLLHYATEQAAPVELPIPRKNVPMDSVRFFPFKGAYFISPAAWPLKGDEPRPSCISVWWFHPRDGRTDETCVPVDALHAQVVTYAPSRIGLLRKILHRSTPHGHKPGGIYLTRPDGRVEKIHEGMTNSISVAPDGCAVAVRDYTNVKPTLTVIELCGDNRLR